MSDTLVLNTANQPVDIITWQTAMRLWYQGKVEIIVEYATRFVGCTIGRLNMPAVVRHVKGLFKRRRKIKFSRQNIYARDKGKCQYCGLKVTPSEFTYEHVVPQSRGGKTNWENIVVACTPCNQRKGDKTPAEAGMRLLTLPVKPSSLPESMAQFRYKQGMPEEWISFLYWTGELDQT
jgi:hypothetical protein